MHYLIKAEEAEVFCVHMLKRHKLPQDLINEAMEKFDRVVKTDLAIRIVHNRATKIDENEKNKFISFDSLMEFVICSCQVLARHLHIAVQSFGRQLHQHSQDERC